MARQPRIEFPGAVYHVLARGDRREEIFVDQEDRECFLEALEEVCGKTGWKIYAWVLMSNHYHIVVETPRGNLVAGMKWLQNTYTRRFNSRHRLWGHVFGGRYKSILVEEGIYSRQLVDYVHLNPVRARLVKRDNPEDLLSYPWSSLVRNYMVGANKRPTWLDPSKRLAVEAEKESLKDRKRYLKYLHGVAMTEGKSAGKELPENQSLQSTLVRGWYWGSEDFREKLLQLAKKKSFGNANYRSSPLMKAKRKEDAEEIIGEGLKKADLNEAALPTLKSSHSVKVAIAVALKVKTTMDNIWIANRLVMKTAGHVSQLSRRYRRGEISLPESLEAWLRDVKNA